MKVLYYPFKWDDVFYKKDVYRYPKEIFREFHIIKNLLDFLLVIPKCKEILFFHISLRNFLPIFIARLFNIKCIIKSDHNNPRTLDIEISKHFRRRLYKTIIENTQELIVETAYVAQNLSEVLDKLAIRANIIIKHNKCFTRLEYQKVKNNIHIEKQPIALYYIRFPQKEQEQFNYGLDIFLRSIHFNNDFFKRNKIIIYGNVDNWLINYINDTYGNSCNFEFIGRVTREELLNLFSISKYYILTSREESFNLSLVEAAINKCEIITTFTGVARDFDLEYLNPNFPIYKKNKISLKEEDYVYDFD